MMMKSLHSREPEDGRSRGGEKDGRQKVAAKVPTTEVAKVPTCHHEAYRT